MDISTNYKIVKFDETIGQILVKFDEVSHLIPIDLHPNENGHLLEGDELDNYIRGFFPFEHVSRLNTLKDGVKNLDSIRNLVQPMPELEPQPEIPTNTTVASDDIQELIASIKAQNNLT